MSAEIAKATNNAERYELALIAGDLSKLSTEERLNYYHAVCKSLDLNSATKPFAFIQLNGKLTLYALKDCTEQLRSKRKVSLKIVSREVAEGVYVVTAQAKLPDGREDESIGAVTIEGKKGEDRANAMMKAETKAKRRVTLSVCGLGMLDESEIESISSARPEPAPALIAAPSEPTETEEDKIARLTRVIHGTKTPAECKKAGHDIRPEVQAMSPEGHLKVSNIWQGHMNNLTGKTTEEIKKIAESFGAKIVSPGETRTEPAE